MGMTSLGANRVAAAFMMIWAWMFPTYTLFQHRSVQHLVAALTGARAASAAAGPVRAGAEAQAAIAIVGMALRVPGAQDVLTFWRNLVNGQSPSTF